jgi:hypothetical protein
MIFINSTWPHINHTLVNAGVDGASLHFFIEQTACKRKEFPRSADLIIFEQHADAATDPGGQQSLTTVEALYLRLTSGVAIPPPLVILSYLWVTDPKNDETSWDVGNNRHKCLMRTWEHRMESSFRQPSVESVLAPVAAYHGWSTVSMRNFLWGSYRDGLATRLGLNDCEFASILLGDQIHPSEAGARLMGDALILLLKSAMAVYSPDAHAVLRPVRPYADAAQPVSRMVCVDAEHMAITRNHGWTFESHDVVFNHATKTFRNVSKPGLVAVEHGAELEVAFSTRLPLVRLSDAVTVFVHYLTSYERLGDATLRCTSGCTCEPTLLRGHVNEVISVDTYARVEVTQSKSCVFSYLTAQTEHGSRFKINSMALSA